MLYATFCGDLDGLDRKGLKHLGSEVKTVNVYIDYWVNVEQRMKEVVKVVIKKKRKMVNVTEERMMARILVM